MDGSVEGGGRRSTFDENDGPNDRNRAYLRDDDMPTDYNSSTNGMSRVREVFGQDHIPHSGGSMETEAGRVVEEALREQERDEDS